MNKILANCVEVGPSLAFENVAKPSQGLRMAYCLAFDEGVYVKFSKVT